jgi:hypothetical protein
MGGRYSQTFTRGGTLGQYERLLRLSRLSNALATAAYGLPFLDLCEGDPARLADLDLRYVDAGGYYLPVLENGSNHYATRSSQRLALDEVIHSGIACDMMLIVPENRRILEGSRDGVGLASAIDLGSRAGSAPIIDAAGRLRRAADPVDLVRAYDSHPSHAFYFLCASEILSFLGYSPSTYCVEYELADYRHDLASRFSDVMAKCLVVSAKHHSEDFSDTSTRNTGHHHLYVNRDAPIDKSVLLIGDSHSYSGLAPLLSYMFREVRFIWASRRDEYAPFERDIAGYAQAADHVIEEAAERFFLNNFCSVVPVSERSPS